MSGWTPARLAAPRPSAFANICQVPGKIGILMGNRRYLNQEMNEAGFRSCFSELAPDFMLLKPISTFEAVAVAQEMPKRLLTRHPDLVGISRAWSAPA